jgi:hypothetical protein
VDQLQLDRRRLIFRQAQMGDPPGVVADAGGVILQLLQANNRSTFSA